MVTLPAVLRAAACPSVAVLPWTRLQFLDLKLDCLEILIDGFLKQASLDGIQLLAAPSEAPAPQGRHLVGELLDLQLPELQLLSLLVDGVDQRGGQIPQPICVHLSQVAW